MTETDVLEKLVQHPLLLHAEVAEGGKECLEQLEKLVASGIVGCRTLRPGVQDSTVYWRKKDKVANNSPKVTDNSPKPNLKTRRPKFVSPLTSSETDSTPPKRPRLDLPTPCDGDPRSQPSSAGRQGSRNSEDVVKVRQLREEKKSLERKLVKEEEKLRKLKMVKLYRSKNDLGQLDILVEKWRQVSQDAAEVLLSSSSREPRPTMSEMLSYLHIDTSLIKYSTEQESFY